jgi:hypothetical protein
VLGQVGRPGDGLAALAGHLEAQTRSEERYYDAELHRLRGELLRRAAGKKRSRAEADAEACYRQGLAIAREQGARSLELRVATSLARLLREQRRYAPARMLLAEVRARFTEGSATADLRDAEALLDS